MDRIEKLREIALRSLPCTDEFFYQFYKRYDKGLYSSDYLNYADAYYFAFAELKPSITEGELIVGETKNGL